MNIQVFLFVFIFHFKPLSIFLWKYKYAHNHLRAHDFVGFLWPFFFFNDLAADSDFINLAHFFSVSTVEFCAAAVFFCLFRLVLQII